jgi:hypothetical protein
MQVAPLFLNANKYFLGRFFLDTLKLLDPDESIINLLGVEGFIFSY